MSTKLKSINASLIGLNQRVNELQPSDWDTWLPKFWSLLKEADKLTEQWIREFKRIHKPKKIAELIAEGLNSTQKKIFLEVGECCRGSRFKRCFEFKKNIAKVCGVSRATIFNELKNLEDRLLIVRIKERPAGCRYRKSIIALRTELSESVYDILLREQRNAERRTKRQRAKAKPSPIPKSNQEVIHESDEITLTPEIKKQIDFIGKPFNTIDADLEPYLTDKEKDLLEYPKWRDKVLNRARNKMAQAKAKASGGAPST